MNLQWAGTHRDREEHVDQQWAGTHRDHEVLEDLLPGCRQDNLSAAMPGADLVFAGRSKRQPRQGQTRTLQYVRQTGEQAASKLEPR